MPNVDQVPGIPRPEGLVLAPFRALRYAADRVDLGRVLAPPYDVIDDAQQTALEAADPANVVRLTLPRDEDGPDSRYAVAGRQLQEWRSSGGVRPDETGAPYVYEEEAEGPVPRGPGGAARAASAGGGGGRAPRN